MRLTGLSVADEELVKKNYLHTIHHGDHRTFHVSRTEVT